MSSFNATAVRTALAANGNVVIDDHGNGSVQAAPRVAAGCVGTVLHRQGDAVICCAVFTGGTFSINAMYVANDGSVHVSRESTGVWDARHGVDEEGMAKVNASFTFQREDGLPKLFDLQIFETADL